jgi:hypothetical protein
MEEQAALQKNSLIIFLFQHLVLIEKKNVCMKRLPGASTIFKKINFC